MLSPKKFGLLLLAITTIGMTVLTSAYGQSKDEKAILEDETIEFGENFVLSLGGKLYDNTWSTTNQPFPDGSNPAYPKSQSTVPTDTWRCVSCHGWDYQGTDGALGKVSKDKAFRSLTSLAGREPEEIAKLIKAPPHRLPDGVNIDLVADVLSLFISLGQYDRDSFFDATGKASGDVVKGRDIFEGACMNCHRPDGRSQLTGEAGDRSSLGWIARNRPEQAMHKILNGVPGADMLAVRFLNGDQIADVFAYLQTLDPNEN